MFRHIGIVVKDLKKQIFFYKDLLGLEIYYSEIEKGIFLETILGFNGAEAKIYKLGKEGKTLVELLEFTEKHIVENKKINFSGITHFALTVEKIEDLYTNLVFNGIKFLSPPKVSDDGKHKVCFCQDYDGNYIELVEKIV